MTEIEQLKDELERVKRQASVMREALQYVWDLATAEDGLADLDADRIKAALSNTAGSNLLTREQVQLIIGALAARHNVEGKPQHQEWMDDETFRGAMNAWDMANRALAEARSLGLIP